MNKLSTYLSDELKKLKESGLYNVIPTIEGPQGAWMQVNGRKLLNLCSNNYLGLASHPDLKKAAIEAIEKYGVGTAAVRSIAGTLDLHLELERKLAEFKGAEAVLTLQSGFNANAGTIQALMGKTDTIFSDELNHASIIDGCRLSGAKIVRYKHLDMNSLEDLLKSENQGRKLIISDGVFSMDGDIAPLPDIVEIANKYGAATYVDDAHGEGVLGRGGRGIVDHFDLHGKVDVEMGTMSKALGVIGGIVAGDSVLIEYLRQKERPFLFSNAMSAAECAAAIKGIEILMKSTDLVDKLWSNAAYLKDMLKKEGFDLGCSKTPITPVMIGDEVKARKFSAELLKRGVFAQAIAYPTVPLGKARIRVMVSAIHSKADLDLARDNFREVGKLLNVI